VKVKRIAIIGAGWGGIAALSKFKDTFPADDYEFVLFEKLNDVGGIWHPSTEYIGLTLHSPALTVEFPDYPLPTNINRFERITSNQVFHYLKSYVEHKKLTSHMRFKTSVIKLNYLEKSGLTEITYQDQSGNAFKECYDYVVNTNGWTAPNIPYFKNQDLFEGEVIHAYRMNENRMREIINANKKLILLGAGKSASDMAIALYRHGYSFTWLYRTMYWYWNYSMLNRYLTDKISRFYRPLFYRLVCLGMELAKSTPRLGYGILRLIKFMHIPGKPHTDYRKFHAGRLDENQVDILKNIPGQVRGEISEFYDKGVVLPNGRKISADVVVLCTGSSSLQAAFPLEIDGRQLDLLGINRTYRHTVIPELPNVFFTHYLIFSFGIANYLSVANWMIEYIKNTPSKNEIAAQSKTRSKIFFDDAVMDGSEEYFNRKVANILGDFIEYKELDLDAYKKYLISMYLSDNWKPIDFGRRRDPSIGSSPHPRTRAGGTNPSPTAQPQLRARTR